MSARKTAWDRSEDPTQDVLDAFFREQGFSPSWWSNGAGGTYGRHSHPYHKVLYCARGSIVFHMDDGDVELGPGDRLDIPPATPHSATVGGDGVTCVEAAAPSEPA